MYITCKNCLDFICKSGKANKNWELPIYYGSISLFENKAYTWEITKYDNGIPYKALICSCCLEELENDVKFVPPNRTDIEKYASELYHYERITRKFYYDYTIEKDYPRYKEDGLKL
jgi:hypothetical protein